MTLPLADLEKWKVARVKFWCHSKGFDVRRREFLLNFATT